MAGAPASRALSSAHWEASTTSITHPTATPRFLSGSFDKSKQCLCPVYATQELLQLSAQRPPSCRAITRTFIVESTEARQTDCWHTVIWSCVARPPASPSAASATNATANALSATVTSAPQLSSASATNAPSETTKTNALSVVAR